MQTMTRILLAGAAALACVAAAAQAGPGGPGPMGGQMGGPMAGPMAGPMGIGPGNTPGWSLMTPDEQKAHREKMASMKSYEECKAYLEQHHQQMQERAKAKGVELPAGPAMACDRMKAQGRLH